MMIKQESIEFKAPEPVLYISPDGEPTFPQGILKGFFAVKRELPGWLPAYLMAVKLQKARRIPKPFAAYSAKLLPTHGNVYQDQDGEIRFTTDGEEKKILIGPKVKEQG